MNGIELACPSWWQPGGTAREDVNDSMHRMLVMPPGSRPPRDAIEGTALP